MQKQVGSEKKFGNKTPPFNAKLTTAKGANI
nr:MAG TPA: hypothetical protein [Bacteriophage sp.]